VKYFVTNPKAPGEEFPSLTLDDTRKHYFGHKAAKYDCEREHSEKWKLEHSAVTDVLAKTEGLILDIPCGTGRYFELYKEAGRDFIGMDVSEEMMVQARAKDPDADVKFGDIMEIPLESDSVNMTVCTRLLNLMTEDEMVQAVQELGRVTKDDMVCSLFTGLDKERHRRHWVHREGVFKHALYDADFQTKDGYVIRENVYHVWHCIRKTG